MSAIFPASSSAAPPDDEVARLRVPPHSVEAEQSVLGGLLIDNSAWDRAADLLTDSDFYRFEHKHVYTAVGKVAKQLQALGVGGHAVFRGFLTHQRNGRGFVAHVTVIEPAASQNPDVLNPD